MEKYNLREPSEDTRELIDYLQRGPSRMYDFSSVRYNIDNCECPECSCCDPDMKWLWPVGAGVLAACTPVLTVATATELVSD